MLLYKMARLKHFYVTSVRWLSLSYLYLMYEAASASVNYCIVSIILSAAIGVQSTEN